MLVCRFHLAFSDRLDGGVLRRAGGTLCIVVHPVQTALMERMFAEEVNRREIEGSATGHAPTSLEDNWLAAQLLELLSFVLGLCAVAGDEPAILDRWLAEEDNEQLGSYA